VFHPYSDTPEGGIHVPCYCFEEVFAEKIRALSERLRPRDLYDVIHLYRHDSTRQGRERILSILEAKCAFKGIPVPSMEILKAKPEQAELVAEWENMLGHQVPALPPFEQFWQELPEVFDYLYRAVEKAEPAVIPVGRHVIDTTWQPPAMAQAWHTKVPLEPVRFAAANHLCVQLNYIDAEGNRKTPIIEPYSLRQTSDRNLLLYSVKHETGEPRAYRVDRIQSAEITKIPFTQKYAVELRLTRLIFVHRPSIFLTTHLKYPKFFYKGCRGRTQPEGYHGLVHQPIGRLSNLSCLVSRGCIVLQLLPCHVKARMRECIAIPYIMERNGGYILHRGKTCIIEK